ncbi:beta-galactosidase [Paucibacter sp. TC2R-5]|uniref:glycoside hydrolase family 35 protein n=1 Tax=Paucibacter sp. TC2R-5 TaxID=2893555 RepID=UPI0021E376DE|nr:beta-galactosidase family protein [Paucibacter sp. TC2R-5]MCV2359892.1 beta-galactosidase [Paucibacter sp. TC2R-5]
MATNTESAGGMRPRLFKSCLIAGLLAVSAAQAAAASFTLGRDDFLLNGQPMQVIGCEMHPARIPPEYWQHRLQMARAMGCNTVPIYLFWSHHEPVEGKFDFKTGSRHIARFVKLAQAEGLLVLLRPGPYVCGEWDLGGLPPYLLKHADIGLRGMDPRYMQAVRRYVRAVAKELAPLQITRGGPIAMLQVENEYGSYANDRAYLKELAALWRSNGIEVPFYTADGPTPHMLAAGSLPGAAVGLDSGSEAAHFELAQQINPGVPVFSSETYPGWLTHWGEDWARPGSEELLADVTYLLKAGKSLSFYVAHGGTNFGFTAGANSGGKGYEPDVTSYDYDAPIDEQGRPRDKFFQLRDLIAKETGRKPAKLPAPIPTMTLAPVQMTAFASLWQALPAPRQASHPKPFEALGHYQGLMLYSTRLIGARSGKLVLNGLHDLASVYLDGQLIGHLDRRLGENSLELPATETAEPLLEIMVEAMGRINFGPALIDRKGLTERVTLAGMTLMNWQMHPLPLHEDWVQTLQTLPEARLDPRPGRFFKASVSIEQPADTFLDLSQFGKGMVWVNGHNLGRFWQLGPQQRLYLPAPWLRRGSNEIIVLDLRSNAGGAISGHSAMKP